MAKLNVKKIRLEQAVRFFRRGSMLAGTLEAGSLGIETQLDVESDEPAERILEMIRVGEQSCFTLGAIVRAVPVHTTARLNGQPLEVGAGAAGK